MPPGSPGGGGLGSALSVLQRDFSKGFSQQPVKLAKRSPEPGLRGGRRAEVGARSDAEAPSRETLLAPVPPGEPGGKREPSERRLRAAPLNCGIRGFVFHPLVCRSPRALRRVLRTGNPRMTRISQRIPRRPADPHFNDSIDRGPGFP
mgnify:CR=1 FL=1